jgi:hypothetical protein
MAGHFYKFLWTLYKVGELGKKLRADYCLGVSAMAECRFIVFPFATWQQGSKYTKTIILPCVWCQCDAWSLTSIEKMLLKKIFWPEGGSNRRLGKIGCWETSWFDSKPDSVLSRKSGSTFEVLLETPDGERPLGRHISVCVCLHLQNASSSLNILHNKQESDI